jgi:hypothetical protein
LAAAIQTLQVDVTLAVSRTSGRRLLQRCFAWLENFVTAGSDFFGSRLKEFALNTPDFPKSKFTE